MIQEMKIPTSMAFKYKIKKLIVETGYQGDSLLKVYFEDKSEEDHYLEILRNNSFEAKRIIDKPLNYIVVIFKNVKPEYSLK